MYFLKFDWENVTKILRGRCCLKSPVVKLGSLPEVAFYAM